MRKSDPYISQRLCEELWKLGNTNAEIAAKVGCHETTIYQWITNGYTPSGYHFANFHRAGMDIIYILTGERS
jgi:transposase